MSLIKVVTSSVSEILLDCKLVIISVLRSDSAGRKARKRTGVGEGVARPGVEVGTGEEDEVKSVLFTGFEEGVEKTSSSVAEGVG